MELEGGQSKAGLGRGRAVAEAGMCKLIIHSKRGAQFELRAQAWRRVLPGRFLALRLRAVEVARDDLDTAVEVVFEQLHRTLGVAIFDGQ
jgi:hypothetical protein